MTNERAARASRHSAANHMKKIHSADFSDSFAAERARGGMRTQPVRTLTPVECTGTLLDVYM